MQRIINQFSDKKLGIIAGGAAVVAALAVAIFISGVWRDSNFQSQPVFVVVAARNISPQTEILATDVELVSVPRRYLQPAAIQQLDQVVGRLAATAIPQGTQVTLATTLSPSAKNGIAGTLPAGKRAVSIAVDEVNGVAGLVRPGNFVDCLLTVDFGDDAGSRFTTLTLLEQIPVIAVNHTLFSPSVQPQGPKEKTAASHTSDDSGRQMVTVAVSPEEAATIMLAQESGRVHLTLRPQDDAASATVVPITLDKLTQLRGVVRPRSRPAYLEYRGGRS